MHSTVPKPAAPWFMLFSRPILFAGFQILFAVVFFAAGSLNAWDDSAAWWPISITIANLVCVALLVRFFRAEGTRYRDIFRIERQHVKKDLLALLALFLIAGPVSYLPNPLLAQTLYGDSQAVLPLFIRPLPILVAYASIFLFPITQGLAELATYFGFVMPRLEAQRMPSWLAIALPALMLGFQHIAAPLLPDWRFILWRGLMFIPFAFFAAIVLHWRPRLLPYMAVVHVLMDLTLAPLILAVAY